MSGETVLGIQGTGAALSSVGAYYNAKGQKTTLGAQAYTDEINAKIATMGEQSAILSGQRQEQAVKLNTAQVKSSQKVAMAANGIDLSGGDTPTRILTSTDVVGEVDAATVAANAMRTAFGYQTQSLNYTNKARGERTAANAINPWTAAATTALEKAGTVSESWYKLKKEGAFDKKVSTSYGPQNDWFARNFGQHNLVSDALY